MNDDCSDSTLEHAVWYPPGVVVALAPLGDVLKKCNHLTDMIPTLACEGDEPSDTKMDIILQLSRTPTGVTALPALLDADAGFRNSVTMWNLCVHSKHTATACDVDEFCHSARCVVISRVEHITIRPRY